MCDSLQWSSSLEYEYLSSRSSISSSHDILSGYFHEGLLTGPTLDNKSITVVWTSLISCLKLSKQAWLPRRWAIVACVIPPVLYWENIHKTTKFFHFIHSGVSMRGKLRGYGCRLSSKALFPQRGLNYSTTSQQGCFISSRSWDKLKCKWKVIVKKLKKSKKILALTASNFLKI